MSLNRKLTVLASACTLGLSGCSMPNPDKLDKDGKQFVETVVEEQLHSWDAGKMQPHLDPRMGTEPKDLQSIFQTFSTTVGPIESVDSLERGLFKVNVGTGPDYSAQYKASVKCAKAKAVLAISIIHQNNKWTIANFNLNSDAFKHINQATQDEAKVFVDKFANEIFNGWNVSTLERNADPTLTQNMKTNPLLIKGILWGSKEKLGKLTKYGDSQFANIIEKGGQTYYLFLVKGTFERDKAEMLVGVSKIGKIWKVNQFKIHSSK